MNSRSLEVTPRFVPLPTVRYAPARFVTASVIMLGLAAAVFGWKILHQALFSVQIVYIVLVIWISIQVCLGLLDRPRGHHGSRKNVAADFLELNVVALVPVYNEDPDAVQDCLRGFLRQTRLPNAIVVTNDGSSPDIDYNAVRAWFEAASQEAGVRGTWLEQANGGKRSAQIAGARIEPDADIYITVDSDSILDSRAVSEALLAFQDPKVMSVAAVILSTNYRSSLLARVMDLYTVGLQLFERSAFSRLNSVLVNSGGCAFYRAEIIWDNVEIYLGETLFGKPVHFSDDSLLTLFALERGKAVQQLSCFAFTLMPAKFSHHRRQQLRWMRGSFIRSGWRMRFLPMNQWAYWLHLAKWIMYATMTTALFLLIFTGGLPAGTLASGAVAGIILYTVTVVRYLSVMRSDQSTGQRVLTFATAPLAAVWSLTFLRVLRWYAMITVGNLGWGTRSHIEIHAGEGREA
ncbi:glycosyltransferase [Lysinibacter sp. HNR]|uniref:glycosyltransferase n=1 Tax=Lysinibacter sp. HNR TaxID=3031408 RepID=UPI0024354E4D|nr:glycosyltransferase [Lysinibacter sp. HNR]WGD38142.1 glycosyltransferase [Lysinibacter sp. HNR]